MLCACLQVAEFKQLMGIVNKLQQDKAEQEGEANCVPAPTRMVSTDASTPSSCVGCAQGGLQLHNHLLKQPDAGQHALRGA